jgi:hypothetical protein
VNPARILKVAQWTLPQGYWFVTSEGWIKNRFAEAEYFNLSKDAEKVMVKLSREHNWKITQNKHGWTADQYSDEGLISIHNDSLENLLVQLVEGL